MFTDVSQLHYLKEQSQEHFWGSGESSAGEAAVLLAGSLLGGEIVRVRLLRGSQETARRYQIANGNADATLPYHSWIVDTGDEQWSPAGVTSTRAIIEPYLQGFAFSANELRLTRPLLPDEHIYGFGERTGNMNKRGQAFPVWNVDFPGRHDEAVTSMYTSIPFYTSLAEDTGRASGVLIDHTGKVDVDLGKSEETRASLTVEGDSMVVYFFAGPTPAAVLRQYSELTGHMPLPARWTLGHHQCRWSYTSEQQVTELASRLRERGHPCDAIWLDIDYMDGFKNFTWDPDRFPDPARMSGKLHEQGFHLVTILDPGTKVDETYSIYKEGVALNHFCRYKSGEHFVGSVWPGASVFPDFSTGAARTWWGDRYKLLLDAGVDGLWNDMDEPALTNSLLSHDENEPSLWGKTMDPNVLHRAGGDDVTGPDGPPVSHRFFHNAYGMEMARTSYEGQLHLRPDSRPFVLTRSGTAGMQRYAALWTGDNTSSWAHIRLAVSMCLSVGMSGVPFVGADIGGFWDACDGELLTRFAQLGTLMPFSRNHNALDNPDQEPWAFGEPYESAYRTAIETRYRLLPYLYTLFQQASVDGSPVMRPLFYHYPNDERASDTQDEFLVGDALLVAPIAEEGARSRGVYFPAGLWFDYWDGTEYPGGGSSEVPAPLERWPLFVRGNSIIPTGPVVQYVDQSANDPLTFTCYMATDGLAAYTLYEDDGSTQAYRNGAFARTTISCRVDADGVTVRIDEQHSGYQPRRDTYEVVVRVGNRLLQQQVKAGQGTTIIRL